MMTIVYIFYWGPTILYKKLQVILSKIEGMTAVFEIYL